MKVLSSLTAALLIAPAAGFAPTSFSFSPSSTSTSLFETAEVEAEAAPVEEEVVEFKGAEAISALTKDVGKVLALEDIEKLLPHRYPFLLVDKVIELEQGKRAVGVKSITLNEPQFTGHFPGQPIMPGVLQVEALAQLAGIVCLGMEGAKPGSIFLFAGVDGVKWRKPVVPGDQMIMEVEITKFNARFGLAKATGKAYVDGKVCVEVKEMTFAMAR